MNKDSTRCGAAGLRRSAIVERIRLREEWSALKEIPNETDTRQKQSTINKKQQKANTAQSQKNTAPNKVNRRCVTSKEVNEVLRGVVVLVEVGSEPRALPLRAALSALGASVVPAWSPLVTHIIWSQGGCRSTRAKARALACQLVSPLWVEACAAEGRRLPERIFPAPTRPSDLPSPATLRRFLKKAEQENISLQNLLSDSQEQNRPARLRLSSETDHDTTRDTSANDTSRDTSKDTSRDSIDIEARVNTAPRRGPPDPGPARKPAKAKRKLFTQKEVDLQTTDEESDNETTAGPKKMQPSVTTQRNRKDLAQAERMARILMGSVKSAHTDRPIGTQIKKPPRIVLTGMSRSERQEAWHTIKQLNGKVQQHVDRKTTHVILGSCHEPENIPPSTITTRSPRTARQSPKSTTQSPRSKRKSPKTTRISPKTTTQSPRTIRQSTKTASLIPLSMCNKCNSPGKILSKMFSTSVTVEDCSKNTKNDRHVICRCDYNDISGVKNISDISSGDFNLVFPVKLRCNKRVNLNSDENTQNNDVRREITQSLDILGPNNENIQNNDIFRPGRVNAQSDDIFGTDIEIVQSDKDNNLCPATDQRQNNLESTAKIKPRTVNALLGAARGCKVLRFEWVKDSLKANRWLHHIGYEVRHLKKISQKARVERSALNKMRTEYAYDVFNGMRVKISPDADQKDAVTQLLTLCGAIIQDGDQQNVKNSKRNQKPQPNKLKCRKNMDNLQNGEKKTQNGAKVTFSHLITLIHNENLTQNSNKSGAQTQIQDGDSTTVDFDLTVGKGKGEVNSKWVFDSVAAARMRTTRRYIND